MTDEMILELAAQVAAGLPPLFRACDAAVRERVRELDRELAAIGPDAKLAALRAETEAESRVLSARANELQLAIGDAEVDVATGDEAAPKRCASLRKELADNAAKLTALYDRLSAVDRRIERDGTECRDRGAAFASQAAREIAATIRERNEAAAESIRAAFALIGCYTTTVESLRGAWLSFTNKARELSGPPRPAPVERPAEPPVKIRAGVAGPGGA